MIPHKRGGGGGSVAQELAPAPLPVDQLEEWLKETPIPYIPHEKFSQKGSIWRRDSASLYSSLRTSPILSRKTVRMMDKTLESTMKVGINPIADL